MKKYIKYIIIAIIVIAIIATIVILNINRNNSNNNDDEKLKIVTSFYPIYIMAENITQNAQNIELVNMADVNVGCLHDYTLTTEDMKKVERADIFIANGLGMENFIEKVIDSNEDMYVIDSSKDIQNLRSNETETNAHIWTNIDNYIKQVQNISEELQEKDSSNAEVYKNNTEEYVKQLEDLKNEYINNLEELKGAKAVSLNEAFEYLGQELQMEMTTIETDHEESTMSAEMLKNIIDKVNNENIDMIIIDINDDDTNARTIEQETGAKIYKLDFGLTGNLDKDAYLNTVKYNMDTLLEGQNI